MAIEKIISESMLAQARALVIAAEAGDDEAATAALDELVAVREMQLFREIGKLTREFHDALTSFQGDSRLAELTSTDIPDAKQRLNYVVTMTEQAANNTLSAVEAALPMYEKLTEQARSLGDDWQRFTTRDMRADEFRDFSKELTTFFDFVNQHGHTVRDNLNEILMAQGFQDLTGQIIRRVIKLVEDVEANLVRLIKIAGQPSARQQPAQAPAALAEGPRLEGPQVPGIKSQGAVASQDDVDDLLSSLGF